VLGASHSRAASGRTPTNQNQFPTGVLVTVLLAAMLGAAAILVVRRSIPVRVGGSGRRREQPERALEPTVEPRPAEPIERMSASPAVQDIELERAVPGLHERPPTAAAYVHAVPQPEVWQQAHRAAPSVERCDIKLWRGYVKCQLYAAVAGSASAWAVSPSFRLRDEDAPNAGALQALSTLLAELEHSGWAVITTGPTWYGHRLERSPDGDA
jgi:hypothetical protein